MKTITLLTALLFVSIANAQVWEQDLSHFDKIIASPYVELILDEGSQEHVRIEASGIDEDDLNIVVKGKTLKIYLDNAKLLPKRKKYKEDGYKWKEEVYKYARVKAYVTYKTLRKLKTRGEERVVLNDIINEDKFKLKVLGESEVQIEGVNAERFKVALYGDNEIYVSGGKVKKQIYRSYGESYVDARGLEAKVTKSKTFGETEIRVHSDDKLRINAFGEVSVSYSGNAKVSKGIVLGESDIYKRR